ncbi:hypothetical protein INT45_003679 [Circinella minor]|uniref:Uncharacterized protein n=1 Tax=Circinella minor TaxID=1195481 RepID=A0A8H7S3H0_9FUNG|nr:hypothetical protein INT45_003679 [Circinella minor]
MTSINKKMLDCCIFNIRSQKQKLEVIVRGNKRTWLISHYVPSIKKSLNYCTCINNPFDPKNINDPKYESTSNENKQQLAKELHHKRADHSLQCIRAPVKYAVARAFHTYGWISFEELKSILASRIPHRDDPRSAAEHYRLLSHSEDMETDDQDIRSLEAKKRKHHEQENI